MVLTYSGIVERLNQINPYTYPTTDSQLHLDSASIGRFGCGIKTDEKSKAPLPGGKWVCWNAVIGKRNGSRPHFLEGRERPAPLPIYAKNLQFKNKSPAPDYMQ